MGIKLEKRVLNKNVISFGDFSSVTRELIYLKEGSLMENKVLIEVFMEVELDNTSIDTTFGNFPLSNLQGIFFFIRFQNITKGYIKNDRINLQQAIKLMKNNNHYTKRKHSQKLNINVFELNKIGKNIGVLLLQSLANMFVLSKNGRDMLLESDIRSFISPKEGYTMNLHSRICKKLLIKESDSFVLLYKAPFTRTPIQMSWVMYCPRSELIMVMVYNNENQNYARIDITMDFVLKFLPFTKQALKSKDFFNCGRRIFTCFKNTLLLEYKLLYENNFAEPSCIGEKGTYLPNSMAF